MRRMLEGAPERHGGAVDELHDGGRGGVEIVLVGRDVQRRPLARGNRRHVLVGRPGEDPRRVDATRPAERPLRQPPQHDLLARRRPVRHEARPYRIPRKDRLQPVDQGLHDRVLARRQRQLEDDVKQPIEPRIGHHVRNARARGGQLPVAYRDRVARAIESYRIFVTPRFSHGHIAHLSLIPHAAYPATRPHCLAVVAKERTRVPTGPDPGSGRALRKTSSRTS